MLRPRLVLGAHHLAFLRATFQGLDTRTAWRRYLAFVNDEGLDLRRLEQRRTEMLTELLRLAEAAGVAKPADHPVNQARAVLVQDLSAQDRAQMQLSVPAHVQPALAHALPSLDEFIEASGLDPDTYAEAEWLALYRERYGLSQPVAVLPASAATPEPVAAVLDRRAVAERVRALGVLAELVRHTPRPQDALGVWIAAPTCDRLQAMGWRSMTDLADAVQREGRRGWRSVPGLGLVRARALERWLAELHRSWQQPFPEAELDPHQRARRRWLGVSAGSRASARTGAGPRPDHWPSVLSAADTAPDHRTAAASGATTSLTAPTFDRDGQQRIVQWLERHRAPASTWRAYRKEAERLWWWCGLVRRCRIAELVEADLMAFEAFLRMPPATWTNPTPLPRTDPDWRPFRGGLSAASCAVALRIVRTFLSEACPGMELGRTASSRPANARPPQGQDPAPPSPARLTQARPGAHFAAPAAGASCADAGRRIASPPGLATLPSAAFAGPAARRFSLVHALMSACNCTLDEALSLRLTAENASGAPAVCWPDGRMFSADSALLALIRDHHRDAGLAPDGPDKVPVLLALRPGPRRWLVRDGQVALSAWPVPFAPRAWTLAAARRSLERAVACGIQDVRAG